MSIEATTKKYLDYQGVTTLWRNVKTGLAGKSDSNHTHSVATTTTDGLMSAADKAKLDELATVSIADIESIVAN